MSQYRLKSFVSPFAMTYVIYMLRTIEMKGKKGAQNKRVGIHILKFPTP